MEIILKKDVQNLGYKNDIVTVKTGYAVNYLIPQGYAILATPSAKKVLAENIRQQAHKEAKLVADAQAAAAKLNVVELVIAAKVGEKGKIYGSVTAAQVAEALEAKGYSVEKKDITVPTIKELGVFEAKIRCYKTTAATVKVTVVAENAAKETPAEEAPAAAEQE